jgi:uncharacterized protein YtpQ (UPF0354 family)
MGLLDRFFGPPTKDKFAKLMMDKLRAVGDTRTATYDQKKFRLLLKGDEENAGVMSLHNLYSEFSATPREKRAEWLKRICIGLLGHLKDTPDEFEDVKPDLRPTIRTRSFVEHIRSAVEGKRDKEVDVPAIPVSDHLMACIVYDLPDTMRFVTADDLKEWGVTVYEAMEAARQNLQEIPFPMMQLGDNFYIIETGEAYDAARLLLLDVIRGLNLQGQPVAMAVTRNCLIITGSDDIGGLTIMAQLAQQKLEEPRQLCSYPITLEGDEWLAWLDGCDSINVRSFELANNARSFTSFSPLMMKSSSNCGWPTSTSCIPNHLPMSLNKPLR